MHAALLLLSCPHLLLLCIAPTAEYKCLGILFLSFLPWQHFLSIPILPIPNILFARLAPLLLSWCLLLSLAWLVSCHCGKFPTVFFTSLVSDALSLPPFNGRRASSTRKKFRVTAENLQSKVALDDTCRQAVVMHVRTAARAREILLFAWRQGLA